MDQIIHTKQSHSEEPFCEATERAYDLLLLGQIELTKKNLESGLALFTESCHLKPGDPKLYFEQGLSLFDLGSEDGQEKTLLIANKKFKMATSLFPEYFEAWQLWGMSLSLLGKIHQETHYFLEAETKLLKALEYAKEVDSDILYELFFEYALVKAAIANRSGEACDWKSSIEAFEKASTMTNGKTADFWNRFGLSCLELTELVNEIKLCVKAIHCFKSAIALEANDYESWKNLSRALQFLYNRTHDEDHFTQGSECFNACTQLNPLDADIWLNWALFLAKNSRITEDTKRLSSCLEKCAKAYAINPHKAEILACWGENLAFLGEKSEQIEKIHEGQNKVIEAIELAQDNPIVWQSLGETFNSLARYFNDIDYHYQAIEKFQQGISLDRSKHEIWFAIGCTYTLIGKDLSDTETLEQALRFYEKAITLKPGTSSYHFQYAHCLSKLGELSREDKWLEFAILEFEKALHTQKNAVYLHPDWLFEYARTLDLYADFFEEEKHYHKAIEIFSHVLMIDPDFPNIHNQLALAYSHLGELSEDLDSFYRALHFFKLASKHDVENDSILVDLGVTLINIAEHTHDISEAETCYQDAEVKLTQAAKAGNLQAYYQLACLFSLKGDLDKSLSFLLKADSFNALPYTEELLEDEWLDRLKGSSAFGELMHYLEKKESLQEDL